MSAAKKWVALAATVAAATIVLGVAPSAGAAPTKCPSGGTPAPGSTITGGLEVDDVCVLTDVTIKGGVTVDPLPVDFATVPLLELRSGSVTGGVVVNGGVLGLGLSGDTSGVTNQPVTISGGITLNRPAQYILAGATIHGGITMNGGYDWASICDGDPFCFTPDPLCGNTIYGNVTITGDNTEQVFVGDPKEQFFANANCEANTIHGSVFMTDSNFIRFDGEPSEIEGDTVSGSIHVDHSTAEVNENTIGGSLLCTNGSVNPSAAGPGHSRQHRARQGHLRLMIAGAPAPGSC
jgi:hypothetical protein